MKELSQLVGVMVVHDGVHTCVSVTESERKVVVAVCEIDDVKNCSIFIADGVVNGALQ